jgi:hypothetical protein
MPGLTEKQRSTYCGAPLVFKENGHGGDVSPDLETRKTNNISSRGRAGSEVFFLFFSISCITSSAIF